MLLTPIYIAMTFLKTWRIKTFRTKLLQYLNDNTSVAFLKIPENASETPTLSSKLCVEPNEAHLCEYSDYTSDTRVCSMRPPQIVDASDWISCKGGLPLGHKTQKLDDFTEGNDCLNILLECEMDQKAEGDILFDLTTIGEPLAWKAGTHLALLIKSDAERLSMIGANFILGDFLINNRLPVIRIQTLAVTGKPQIASQPSFRNIRKEIVDNLKKQRGPDWWRHHAALLRKFAKVADVNPEPNNMLAVNGHTNEKNFSKSYMSASNLDIRVSVSPSRKSVSSDKTLEMTDNTENELKDSKETDDKAIEVKVDFQGYVSSAKEGLANGSKENSEVDSTKQEIPEEPLVTAPQITKKSTNFTATDNNATKSENIGKENMTVEIKHSITPKKSLKLDLKKSIDNLQHKSSSLLNLSSQIKSLTTHKKIIMPKKSKQEKNVSSGGETSTVKSDVAESIIEVVDMSNEKTASNIEEKSKIEKDESVKRVNSKSMDKCGLNRPLTINNSTNVIIYSDSVVTRDNLLTTLKDVLDPNYYTIYPLTRAELEMGAWIGRTALVVVAGGAGSKASSKLCAALQSGAKLLAVCSDLLHVVLPQYKTAEIRENEVVQYSYDRWHAVKMKHHIFCYQASPAKKQFSTENDRQQSTEIESSEDDVSVEILAHEETWRTPSLLRARYKNSNGVAVFSQVHLETDPRCYLGQEGNDMETARLEIIKHILKELLGLKITNDTQPLVEYTKGYFLGNHVHKTALVSSLSDDMVVQCGPMKIQWYSSGCNILRPPSEDYLPVSLHECPPNFDTKAYYENLNSEHVGRLLLYTDVISSTDPIVRGQTFAHGFAVCARQQTKGVGRRNNSWISPIGSVAISLQLHLPGTATKAAALAQHVAALAAIRAVTHRAVYQDINLRIKWPNDIYVGNEVKIGGVAGNGTFVDDRIILNIGLGVNLDNSTPTTCINDLIANYNSKHSTNLPLLTTEVYLALFCSQFERIFDYVKEDSGLDAFLEQYYLYWLHGDAQVTVQLNDEKVSGKVIGVDEFGYLRVRCADRTISVQPDNNSFDMMTGLIAPKSH